MLEFYILKVHFNNILNMTMKIIDLTEKAEFEPFISIAVVIGASVVI